MIDELDTDIWGQAYRIVEESFRLIRNTRDQIMSFWQKPNKFFLPIQQLFRERPRGDETPPFTSEELSTACQQLKMRKAPGPDGLTKEVVKVTVTLEAEYCRRVFNRHLIRGEFPSVWK